MTQLKVQNHVTAQWHDLVKEAEAFNGIILDEELESYLVFLLMRYTEQPDLASKVMALEYLHGSQTNGSERQEKMRDVGDQCLLFSGLFPKRAERRRVKISYYVALGQTAYQNVSDLTQSAMAAMFNNLANSFVQLMDTLQVMRNLHQPQVQLDAITAMELWQETDSQQARRIVEQVTQAVPSKQQSKYKH